MCVRDFVYAFKSVESVIIVNVNKVKTNTPENNIQKTRKKWLQHDNVRTDFHWKKDASIRLNGEQMNWNIHSLSRRYRPEYPTQK